MDTLRRFGFTRTFIFPYDGLDFRRSVRGLGRSPQRSGSVGEGNALFL